MNELQNIVMTSEIDSEKIRVQLHNNAVSATITPRNDFYILQKSATNFFEKGIHPRFISLSGLRGTGKTTLLWQVAEFIYNNFTNNIFLFNVNTIIAYNYSILDVIQYLEQNIFNQTIRTYNKPVVLLFDEVHEDKHWTNSLKIIFDELQSAFIIATGSSALLLQSTADLASRMLTRHIFPLNFSEFLKIRKVIPDSNDISFNEQLKQTLFYSTDINELESELKLLKNDILSHNQKIENIQSAVKDYIEYYNITRFCRYNDKTAIADLTFDLFKRIVFDDIPKISSFNNFSYPEKILRRIAASDEINIQSLSQATGIKQDKIIETLEILTKAELLNVLFPYGGIDSKINKARKYFFMSPSVRKVILTSIIGTKTPKEIFTKLIEDILVMYFKRIFKLDSIVSFTSSQKLRNPDFVIETGNTPVVMEVGIGKKTTKKLIKSRINYRYGIIINSEIETYEMKDNNVILPLTWFLLL